MPKKDGGNADADRAYPEGGEERSLTARVEGATSAWLDQMAAMRRVEVEFAGKLAECETAPEAVAVCTEWLSKRVDSLVAVQHHLIDLWLEWQADKVLGTAPAASAKEQKTSPNKRQTS